MPTPADIGMYIATAMAYVATVSVPLGLLGSTVEAFGRAFALPKVEAFGDKIEKFFFDLPGLLGRSKNPAPTFDKAE
jgi:hypothetical protein